VLGSMLAVALRSIACFAFLEYRFAVEDRSLRKKNSYAERSSILPFAKRTILQLFRENYTPAAKLRYSYLNDLPFPLV
jgi:hypothetical protein